MGLDLTTGANLLFTRFLPGVRDTLNLKAEVHRDPRQEEWHGSSTKFALHTALSNAMGWTSDGAAFPNPGNAEHVQAQVYRKLFHAIIKLSDGMMYTGKGPAKEVAQDASQSEIRRMMEGCLKLKSGYYFGDGTGVATTIRDSSPGSASTDIECDISPLLLKNGQYDLYNSTRSTKRATVTVDNIEQAISSNGYANVNFAAALPAAAVQGDVLVWRDSNGIVCNGLDSLIDDAATTFQGVNVSNEPEYSSVVLSNSGTARNISAHLIRQLLAGLFMRSGDMPGDLALYGHPLQLMAFEELYEGNLLYSPSDKESGRSTMSFQSALGKVKYKPSTNCPPNKLFAADLSEIVYGVQKPLGWRTQKGEVLMRSDQAGVWTATLNEIGELYIEKRHTSAKIEDLTYDAPIGLT